MLSLNIKSLFPVVNPRLQLYQLPRRLSHYRFQRQTSPRGNQRSNNTHPSSSHTKPLSYQHDKSPSTTTTITTKAVMSSPTSSYTYFCCNPACCAVNIAHNVPRSPYPQFQHQFVCSKCGAQQLTRMRLVMSTYKLHVIQVLTFYI
jgi:hypothetical protein